MGDALGRLALMSRQGPEEAPAEPMGTMGEGMGAAKAMQRCPECGAEFPVQNEGEGAEAGEDVREFFEANHPPTAMSRGPMR